MEYPRLVVLPERPRAAEGNVAGMSIRRGVAGRLPADKLNSQGLAFHVGMKTL